MYKFLKNALKIFRADFLFVKFYFLWIWNDNFIFLEMWSNPLATNDQNEKEIFIESFKL